MGIDYQDFLNQKAQINNNSGFEPLWIPDFLFDFQKALVEWAIKKGRAAIFADCGLGKTPMQLVWAENVIRKTGGRVLIVAPLAVSFQTIQEGEKFGIEVIQSKDGKPKGNITITNYEKIHLFDSTDYDNVVCDESSAIKSFHGVRRELITAFMKKLSHRLLCTATAAPNDFIELGTSSEALGNLDRMDMIHHFFKNDERTSIVAHDKWTGQNGGRQIGWRLKGHAEIPFWKWVVSWARAVRKPSDLGYSDDGFILPELKEVIHIIKAKSMAEGMLFELPAVGLAEEREEQRRTIYERCERALELVNRHNNPVVIWCNLNEEGKILSKLIPECTEISGSDNSEKKEKSFIDFAQGNIRVLVTKPKIGGFGLNWQHCSNVIFFPSHSYEQYYQAIRRCWRFGQKKPVKVDIVTTEGGANVVQSLHWKAIQADKMFTNLAIQMNQENILSKKEYISNNWGIPTWIKNG
jgi:hypothetical protein